MELPEAEEASSDAQRHLDFANGVAYAASSILSIVSK
jgi:FtsZ-interacting cell division protein YlmF